MVSSGLCLFWIECSNDGDGRFLFFWCPLSHGTEPLSCEARCALSPSFINMAVQWAAVHLCVLLKDIWWIMHNLALEICLLNSVLFPVIMGLLSMLNQRTKGKLWAPGFSVRGLHNHSGFRLSSVILSPLLVVYQLYFLLPTKTMTTKSIFHDFANCTLRSEIVL